MQVPKTWLLPDVPDYLDFFSIVEIDYFFKNRFFMNILPIFKTLLRINGMGLGW